MKARKSMKRMDGSAAGAEGGLYLFGTGFFPDFSLDGGRPRVA
jgi:hypothetical protein